jgi:hypothetical protein
MSPCTPRPLWRAWARRVLSGCAALMACISFLVAASSLRNAGWSNERTILYAAEGGLMSPREALMDGLLLGSAMSIWIAVFVATIGATPGRARRSFRATAVGAAIAVALSITFGLFCGDLAGLAFVGSMLALPMALAAVAIRRWGMSPDRSSVT